MNGIREILNEKVGRPAASNRGLDYTVGKITGIDEQNDSCSVIYLNKDGQKQSADNVSVRYYGLGAMSWFPKVNDVVYIEGCDGVLTITTPCYGNYSADIRTKETLDSDTIPKSTGSTCGGSVF